MTRDFDTSAPSVERQDFLAGIGSVTSTVTIIAAQGPDGLRAGMTATAVCSLSDSPPMLLACLNKSTTTLGVVQAAGRFTVNFLSDDQADLAGRFAKHSNSVEEADAAFDDADWCPETATAAKGALVSCHCQLADLHDAGTHYIVTGRVTGIDQRDGQGPLLYGRQSFQRRPEKV